MARDDNYILDGDGNRILIGLTIDETREFERLDELISDLSSAPTDDSRSINERRWLVLYDSTSLRFGHTYPLRTRNCCEHSEPNEVVKSRSRRAGELHNGVSLAAGKAGAGRLFQMGRPLPDVTAKCYLTRMS